MKNEHISKNMFFTLAYQLITVAFGLVIPNLVLKVYGASTHGFVATLNNLMNYVMLLNAGLSTASVQALYKPLMENSKDSISATVNAIRKYYALTAVFMIISIISIAFILPSVIRGEVADFTVVILMIVMGTQYILENTLFNTESSLLQADNRLFVVSQINSLSYIVRVLIQVLLINLNVSIIFVMFVPVLLVFFRSILIKRYVLKNYNYLDKAVLPDKEALSKRKNALIHQLSGLVLNNTDVLILSVFWNQTIVSKYSVYSLVFAYLYLLLSQIFSSSLVASFGKKIVEGNSRFVRKEFKKVTIICNYVISIIYSTSAIMILPFVSLYTRGINTIEYVDKNVAVLFIIYGVFNAMRIPFLMLIDAAGLYKETQHQALIEMTINITVSLLLVIRYGITGVLIGTIASFAYRTIATINFTDKNILKEKSFFDISRVFAIFSLVIIVYFLNSCLPGIYIENWTSWILLGTRTMVISTVVTTLFFVIFEFKYIKSIFLERTNI